jgi:hypothetical protein
MTELAIYWRGWSENQLASHQQDQGNTNHCAKFAAASALNMLYGISISGQILVDWLSNRFLQGTLQYTIWGNNYGSLVIQTANLVRKFSRMNQLVPKVKSRISTKNKIKDILKDNNTLALVTMTYFLGREPVIAKGRNTTTALGNSSRIGGHVMILGAYDPGHQNDAGVPTPWGFLSSWPGKDYLYWMTEEDFSRSWGKLSLFNTVTVRRL